MVCFLFGCENSHNETKLWMPVCIHPPTLADICNHLSNSSYVYLLYWHLPFLLSVRLSLCLSVFLSVRSSLCLSVCPIIYLSSICPFVSLSINLSVRPFGSLSACLSVLLCVGTSLLSLFSWLIYLLSVCPFAHLSAYLPTSLKEQK
jgi:hypothetical protein